MSALSCASPSPLAAVIEIFSMGHCHGSNDFLIEKKRCHHQNHRSCVTRKSKRGNRDHVSILPFYQALSSINSASPILRINIFYSPHHSSRHATFYSSSTCYLRPIPRAGRAQQSASFISGTSNAPSPSNDFPALGSSTLVPGGSLLRMAAVPFTTGVAYALGCS